MRQAALTRLCCLVAALVVTACSRPPAAAPTVPAATYPRWDSPDGFVVADPDGGWAWVATDAQGQATHVVAGLPTQSSWGELYPKPPRVLFADPLLVPLDPYTTLHVPARSHHPLLLVTVNGFTEARPPRPIAELADALRNVERDRGTVRGIVTEQGE
jgi:hypothetical protein